MRFFYIIITYAYAHSMSGRQSPTNHNSYFGYAVTLDSTYVVSLNTANDFSQSLDSFANTLPDSTLQVVSLLSSDFPKSPEIDTVASK